MSSQANLRGECLLCGEPHAYTKAASLQTLAVRNQQVTILVCSACLSAAPQEAAARMRNYAAHLRDKARHIEQVAKGVEQMEHWGAPEDTRKVGYVLLSVQDEPFPAR